MSKLNPPTLTRPQDPNYCPIQYATNVVYDYQRKQEEIERLRKLRSKPMNFICDVLYGRAFIPEHSVVISHEELPKKLTNIDKAKMKIANFILFIANRIGEKHV